MAEKTRVLCILTGLLGNGDMSQRLIGALDQLPDLEPTYVLLTVEDYLKYPAPRWARVTNPWQSQYMARKKAQSVIQQPFDILIVHGWEYAIAFRDLAQHLPAAVMMDSVPATMDLHLRRRGLGGWKRWLSHQVHDRAFRAAVRDFQFFLPKSSDCAASLEHDYGVERKRCFVTLVPQDVHAWTPGQKNFAPPWRLLFVGNDFARKGGEFLLRLYSEHLTGTCTLTIASNDFSLVGRQLPAGVELLRGATREELLETYRTSHIFIFPTLQDFAPQVLAEASSAGLPCLAGDVDGVRDLIRDGETGFIMPRGASEELWAARIQRLLADPAELRSMSDRSRRFAEENLGLERFQTLISSVMERLRDV
ncbi:MAG: putative glycosyltransferase [Bryobacterales bacterium]|jgi:glycosyltransferase involved in cell wall biosynthesis|nr:putative glycosyltransferase [Bryobacterales bacterium]